MMTAVDRLTRRPQFFFVAAGHVARRHLVVVQARQRPDGGTAAGAGFTATKKVGNAVIRNRCKRRLREAARALLPELGQAGTDYVFIARTGTADAAWPRLLDDVRSALLSLRADIESGRPPKPHPQARRGGKAGKPPAPAARPSQPDKARHGPE